MLCCPFWLSIWFLHDKGLLYFSRFVFFFKQKTAYELRISDWSSDVCSSDLSDVRHRSLGHNACPEDAGQARWRPTRFKLVRETVGRHAQGQRELRALAAGAVEKAPVATGRNRIRSPGARAAESHPQSKEIGRASCRERVCKYVKIRGGAVTLK